MTTRAPLHLAPSPPLGLALGLALAVAATAALAGCGSKADADAAATAEPPAAAPGAAPAAEVAAASFSATIEAKPSRAGETAHAVVRVVPTGGYKVNQEYPYKCKLDAPPEGVTYPTPVVTAIERTKELATMKLPYVAAKPGTVKVGGLCSISVCTDENCIIEKVALATDAKVE